MNRSIRLTIDDKEYAATLNDNRTVEDILNMLPMELTLKRYAGHEYYSSLPQKPSISGVPMTSDAHAGGIYYYDRWSAFTILYGNAHIALFEVVHIGDVNEDVITQLTAAGDTVDAKIELVL
ncbi:cyclophilin-like fold protein [Clostridium sp.]|uniref:cyclophilin-like fold protein n=1 Tax=Clostridium sp. TaxID=1506 RepID=UPI002604EDE1|nr:cyclophilin-like fold protein [Clostridium sp.]